MRELWVVPRGSAWVVRLDGDDLGQFEDKTHAVGHAAGIAQDGEGPAEIIVLDHSGSIDERRTYAGREQQPPTIEIPPAPAGGP